jgi:hypothetical protein
MDAMSLGETLLSLAGIAVILSLLMAVTNSVRAENADQQTRQILRSLRMALDQYHQATHTFPPSPMSVAIHYLQTLPSSQNHMRGLQLRTDSDGFSVIDDGYGRPLRYFRSTPRGDQSPDFVSAGPDGIFGDRAATDSTHQQAVIDNVYGSEVQVPNP